MSSDSYGYHYHRTPARPEDIDERGRLFSHQGLQITGLGEGQARSQQSTVTPYAFGGIPGDSPYLGEQGSEFPASNLTTGSGGGGYELEAEQPIQHPKDIRSPLSPVVFFQPSGESIKLRNPDLDSLLEVSTEEQPLTPTYQSSHKSHKSEPDTENSKESPKEKRRSLISPSSTLGEIFSPLLGTRKSPRLQPEEIIQQRAEFTAQWGVHWYLPTVMVSVLVFGVIGAVGHHMFYSSLHETSSKNQLTKIRYGTAFAFFVKASLVGSIETAYRQRIWHTMRKRGMSLRAIDAMFGVLEDPTFFFTFEMVRKAKLATFLAVLRWLIPIASVISPSALTSEMRIRVYPDASCTNVPTLNFSHEATYYYKTEGLGPSIAFWNDTGVGNGTYYDQPSFYAKRIATRAILGHASIAPYISPCGLDDCTYRLNFNGPAYKCVDAMKDPVLKMRAPFNASKVAPEGQFIYFANVNTGDYERPNKPPQNKSFDPQWTIGTFFFEPELWLGHSTYIGELLPANHPYRVQQRWNRTIEPHVTNCRMYHANYILNVTYKNNVQKITVVGLTYQRPVMLTSPGDPSPDPALFIRPGHPDYQVTSVYHALGSVMREYLTGNIFYNTSNPKDPGHIVISHTEMSATMLKNKTMDFPPSDFPKRVERFFEDILFSMWSEPDMVVSDHINITCLRKHWEDVFIYYKEGLWIGYSLAVAATVLCCIVGAFALYENGISSDTLFSRIMVTTRNPTIDRLSKGACLGSDPFPRELEGTKFRFGVLDERDGQNKGLGYRGWPRRPGHCAFGTVAETSEIVKGGLYSGLCLSGEEVTLQRGLEESESEDYDEFQDCEEGPLLSKGS